MASPALLQLPSRPIAFNVNPKMIGTSRGGYFSIIILLLVAVGFAWFSAPDILKDLTINQNPVSVDSNISNGKCKTYQAILTTCSADVSYTYQRQSYRKHVELTFVDLHSGDYEANTVISGDHPELATLSLGLDYLWDRIITLAVFLALMLGFCVFAIYGIFRRASARKKISDPAPLTASDCTHLSFPDFAERTPVRRQSQRRVACRSIMS